MRRTLLVGLGLIVVGVLAIFLDSWFGLDLEPVALFGIVVGAVLALVPDRTPFMRLTGFVGGVVVTWVAYFLRAGVLPDTAGGRAVALGLVIALAAGIAAVSFGRIPLWSTLLGAAALAGAYEFTFDDAPPEVATTSVIAATSLLFTAALGFLVAAVFAPAGEEPVEPRESHPLRSDDEETHSLDDMMEESK
jgi:hypothetical protein